MSFIQRFIKMLSSRKLEPLKSKLRVTFNNGIENIIKAIVTLRRLGHKKRPDPETMRASFNEKVYEVACILNKNLTIRHILPIAVIYNLITKE